MALSGSIYTNVSSHWQLKLSWSATQSISGNYSTVTASLYWIALDSYGAVNSSATKTCLVSVNHNDSQTSASGMASLNGNETKLIHSHTYTVNHASDGTGSFTLDGWFQAQVTLNGTYYDTINLTQTTFYLNTIPRASSLTSSASWTAGSDFTISIDRASSSFTHTLDIHVNGVLIKSVTGLGSSGSSGFSTSNNTTIFQQINGGSSQDTSLTLTTYDGSSNIGSKTYTGTCTAPASSSLTYSSSFNIGDTVSFSISRNNSSFTHTVTMSFGSPVYSASATNVGTSGTISYSASSMYSKIPNSNSGTGTFTITTYYNGVQVQGSRSYSFTAKVASGSSNPSFSSSYISYADTNSTITGITGNNQYIVQNKSTFTAYVNTGATGVNYATISSYVITINGLSATLTSTGNHTFGTLNASSNVTLSVKAVDSRGNSTTVSKTVTIVPYSSPTISAKAIRTDNFESETTLSLSGVFSTVNIGGTNKNAMTVVEYQYKASTSSTYNTATNFTYTASGSTYTATNVVLTLDNLQSWNILITVKDTIGTTVTYTVNVSTGQPLMFIDSALNSVGVNQFPVNGNSFEVSGQMYLNASPSVSNSTATAGSVFGSDLTQKIYLNFGTSSGSNDPAFIMHETSSASASINRGVLHLCPSDDNTSDTATNGDYVAIHGTNDPETIRIYTDGKITTPSSIQASGYNGSTMELRASGGTPYIDFSNDDTSDYDMRIILTNDSLLTITGGDTTVDGQLTVNGGSGTYQGIMLNAGWFRSSGSTGWYNQTYGGGWYMIDNTWVRSYQNKDVYTGGVMKADGGLVGHGYDVLEAWSGGYKVQIGTANLGSMSAGTQDSMAITFPHAFGSTPTVFLSLQNPEHITGYMNLQTGRTESTTGFTLYGICYTALTYCYVTWIAIGS